MLTDAQINAVIGNVPYAAGLPNHADTSPEFLQWEKEQVFGRTWTAIANSCMTPNAGDVRSLRFLNTPMVVRDKQDQIRVFHNVCSHRGNELVWNAENVGARIRCLYHSWTYDLQGNLFGTPHVGGWGFMRHPVCASVNTGYTKCARRFGWASCSLAYPVMRLRLMSLLHHCNSGLTPSHRQNNLST